MTTHSRLGALGLAALLASTGPALAIDPNGSTPSNQPPRDPAPATALPLPTPGGQRAIVIDGFTPPPGLPDGFAAEEAAHDSAIDLILLGATDLAYGHDVCHGLITCCNSYWVQGCNADYFEDVCTYYGGTVQVQNFSDGSLQYECHEG